MNEILHANIFFIIASVATVVFTIIVSLVLYQAYKLVRSLRRVVERIEAGSERLASEAEHVRSFIANGGMFSKLIGVIMSAVTSQQTRQRKKGD